MLSHANFQSTFDGQEKDSIIYVLASESEIIETVNKSSKKTNRL